MLVPHRKRHHALIEASFAEERFRMFIDEVENPLAARFNFVLERTHYLDVGEENFNLSACLRQNRNHDTFVRGSQPGLTVSVTKLEVGFFIWKAVSSEKKRKNFFRVNR